MQRDIQKNKNIQYFIQKYFALVHDILHIHLFICIALFQNNVTFNSASEKSAKYSTLFASAHNKVISGHFAYRTGLEHTLVKPIIPTESRH